MTLIPDRYKHTAIIASTGVLPPSVREPARLALLTRLHRGKTRRAQVLVIVHPKCGGTWLRVMLFRLYQRKYGLESRRVVKTDELKRLRRGLPSFLVTNGHYSYERVVEDAFAAPRPSLDLAAKKLVFLARHPCDIAVSWFLQFTKRTTRYKRALINYELETPIPRRKKISLSDFALHEELGVPGLIRYMNAWATNLERADQSLLVRYEDLRVDAQGQLERLSSFLGLDADEDQLRDAVEFASFDNLRALEKANYFDNDGLRLRKSGDPDTLKVRRGVVGGYRDHFAPEQADQLEKLVNESLSPVFGYGAPQEPLRRTQEG